MSRREKLIEKIKESPGKIRFEEAVASEYKGYVFSIQEDAESSGWIVDFPDIPNIITSGDTLIQAFAHAIEALDLHLETMVMLKLPLPEFRHRLTVESAAKPKVAHSRLKRAKVSGQVAQNAPVLEMFSPAVQTGRRLPKIRKDVS